MQSQQEKNTDGSRPRNGLLQRVGNRDFKLLGSSLNLSESQPGQVLYHPGDAVENAYFPCGPTLVSFAVAVDDDREVEAVLVGREGAVGGIAGGGSLPAYSRIAVKIGGPLIRISVRKLAEAQRQSHPLRQLFARYADCLVAQIFQSTACNAAHSIEQRAAKWIIHMTEHTGTPHVPLTHEQLAGLLGVGRSYASRIIQAFKAERVLETARGTLLVRDLAALQRRSCRCDGWAKKHYTEVLSDIQLFE